MSQRETDEERQERYAELQAQAKVLSASQYGRRQLLSGLTGIAATVGAYRGWRWIQDQDADNRIPSVLRSGHEANEALWSRLFRDDHLAPTFDPSESSMLRVNGRQGVRSEIDLDAWEMEVLGPDGGQIGSHQLADIQALPQTDMTVEHKCVEGWSNVVTWGGTRFSNFYEMYADRLPSRPKYVALWTPDRGYYVGLDMDSMLHPQTLLAYELQGAPLTQDHGAPLRLATPLKYGIKQLKRIGTIQFTDEQPDDYWFERGYDYYAHL